MLVNAKALTTDRSIVQLTRDRMPGLNTDTSVLGMALALLGHSINNSPDIVIRTVVEDRVDQGLIKRIPVTLVLAVPRNQ